MAEVFKTVSSWQSWRFFGVLGALLGLAWAVGRMALPHWLRWYGIPLGMGVTFFFYLVWEINGPIYRAARRYFEALSNVGSP